MASLGTTLAAIRRAESGSFKGNYGATGDRGRGGTPKGAYGILDTNWSGWSAAAGLAGANPRSARAQDTVAAAVLQSYYNRYGSWDLATTAWYGGTKSADTVAKNGGKIRNAHLARLVKKVEGFQKIPDVNNYARQVPKGATKRAQGGRAQTNEGWTFPVAGSTEWSGGSFMNKHTKGDRSHHAIDIYAAQGTPIISPVGGTITSVKSGGKLGGTTVAVRGRDGITYYFAHMSKHAAGLERGQKIMAGHALGTVGNTGSARGTKAHLHFSMKKNGKALNPKSFLNGAETSNGVYTDLEYAPDDPTAVTAGQTTQETPFGTTVPEAMVDSVSNNIAGGKRLDPREWIDPNVEKLDLNQTKTDMGSVA